MIATQSLLDGQQLSLTELGRITSGSIAPKHSIKRIDRRLGIYNLHNERLDMYRWKITDKNYNYRDTQDKKQIYIDIQDKKNQRL